MRRTTRNLALVFLAIAVSATVGFFVQGWTGIFAWPLALCAAVVLLSITLVLLGVVVRVRARRGYVHRVRDRLRGLSTEQLRQIMQTPTDRDSQFALVELMKRGVDARPTKEQLFGMLTSGNPNLCANAMTNLLVFYPHLHLPTGLSNQYPPERWQAWIASFGGVE